jgi:hypothetical protein
MSKHDVNIKRLALLLLPTFWRVPLLAALAYAVVSPLAYLHARLARFRGETLYRLDHNGQVCYLRAVLNDQFDPVERRVTITETAGVASILMLYRREEEREQLVPARGAGALVVNRRGFGGVNAVDFWVNIPIALRDAIDVTRMGAIVSAYKLASKRFSINYV